MEPDIEGRVKKAVRLSDVQRRQPKPKRVVHDNRQTGIIIFVRAWNSTHELGALVVPLLDTEGLFKS